MRSFLKKMDPLAPPNSPLSPWKISTEGTKICPKGKAVCDCPSTPPPEFTVALPAGGITIHGTHYPEYKNPSGQKKLVFDGQDWVEGSFGFMPKFTGGTNNVLVGNEQGFIRDKPFFNTGKDSMDIGTRAGEQRFKKDAMQKNYLSQMKRKPLTRLPHVFVITNNRKPVALSIPVDAVGYQVQSLSFKTLPVDAVGTLYVVQCDQLSVPRPSSCIYTQGATDIQLFTNPLLILPQTQINEHQDYDAVMFERPFHLPILHFRVGNEIGFYDATQINPTSRCTLVIDFFIE